MKITQVVMKQKLFAGPLSALGETLSSEDKKIVAMRRSKYGGVTVTLSNGRETEVPYHMLRQIDSEPTEPATKK